MLAFHIPFVDQAVVLALLAAVALRLSWRR